MLNKNKEDKVIPKKSTFRQVFRLSKQMLVHFTILCLMISSFTISINQVSSEKNKSEMIQSTSSLQEYSFIELGIYIEPLSWEGLGSFQISLNETFDLDNVGPVMIILDFTSQGDLPDNPGYQIKGTFNLLDFESEISRSMISSDDEELVRQIVIPTDSEGRYYSNQMELNISCLNEYSSLSSGTLEIKSSSRVLIGDVLLIENFDNYPIQVFPKNQIGVSDIGGLTLFSYIQFTIENETLINAAKYSLNLTIRFTGDVRISLTLFDNNSEASPFTKNQTTANIITATAELQPSHGVNYYSIGLSIYGDSLWGTNFNVTFVNCTVNLIEALGGFGLFNLDIPFFQWPSVPIVGVVALVLWFVPYTLLKFRKWQKSTKEFSFTSLDDDLDIVDPEGIATDDDHDDIKDAFEFV